MENDATIEDLFENLELGVECCECGGQFVMSFFDASTYLQRNEENISSFMRKIRDEMELMGTSALLENIKTDGVLHLDIAFTHNLTCGDYCHDQSKKRKARRHSRGKKSKLKNGEALLIHANTKIPPRYRKAEPANIDMDNFGDCFIGGAPGRGKTHLAAAIVKQWILHNLSANFIFISVPELLQETKHEFNLPQAVWKEGHETIISRCQKCSLLVLDDLGVEKHSDWSIESVYLVVSHRYDNMLPTIITSNLSIEDVSNEVSHRIASRLLSYNPFEVTGKDRRLTE